jgi:hypothetical protein
VLLLRLYLTLSVVLLLLMRTVMAWSLDQEVAASPNFAGGHVALLSFGPGHRVGMNQGEFFCIGLPQWVCQRVQQRLDGDPRRLADMAGRAGERLFNNLGFVMFLLMPLFAGLVMLGHLGTRWRYTEHLVFALHLHAAWFPLLAMLLVPWWPVQLAALLCMPVYALLAMKRAYDQPWGQTLLRLLAVLALYLPAFVAATVVLSLIAVAW